MFEGTVVRDRSCVHCVTVILPIPDHHHSIYDFSGAN